MSLQAALDLTHQTRKKLNSIGISANCFARIAKLPAATMSGHLSGNRPLMNDAGLSLYNLAKEIEQLVKAVSPLRLNFHLDDAEHIRDLLKKLKDGDLTISIQDRSTSAATKAGLDVLASKEAIESLQGQEPKPAESATTERVKEKKYVTGIKSNSAFDGI